MTNVPLPRRNRRPQFLPHEQRVVDEEKELDEKLDKLDAFIDENPLFHKLDVEEQARLKTQRFHMQEYSNILADRITNFPEIEP